jgi:hypothetical protein
MRYWWVNQNQTFRQEIEGGYLWSPKRNKNGHRNPFYEFMREVSPGDIVFSFCDTRIAALGIVSGYCRESPKPEEFGTAGMNWDVENIGQSKWDWALPRELLVQSYASMHLDVAGAKTVAARLMAER